VGVGPVNAAARASAPAKAEARAVAAVEAPVQGVATAKAAAWASIGEGRERTCRTTGTRRP